MKTKPRFQELSKLFKASLGIPEIAALINLIKLPLIVADLETDKIAAANTSAQRLAGYSMGELQSIPIIKLLPNIKEQIKLSLGDTTTRATLKTTLNKRNAVPANIKLEVSRVNVDNPWVFILIQSDESLTQREIEQDLESQRWEALQILLAPSQNDGAQTNIKKILQGGQLLTSAGLLAYYAPAGEEKSLKILERWGKSDFLPESVSLEDVNHLRIPLIWSPKSKAVSDLHRQAGAARLTYLATIPVEREEQRPGLLVVGDLINPPSQNLLQLIQIIASIITLNLSHNSAAQTSRKELGHLREQIKTLNEIQNVISDGIVLVDHNFRIISINSPASTRMGYLPTEVFQKKIEDIFISDPPISKRIKSNSITPNEPLDLGEVRLHRRDGQTMLHHVQLLQLNLQGQTPGFAIFLSDLSQHEEFRNRNRQLEQQALLGEVMAVFAHEVRNPINNISTGLQVMASNFKKDSPIQEEIDRLKDDVHRLADLMKSVLSFSKTKEYRIESIDLNQLINSLIGRWTPRMARHKISHQIQIPHAIPLVKGDRRALEQVFTNIIQNGINAMKTNGGVLGVKVEAPTDTRSLNTVNVSISDTGPGIPDEIKDRIFEPFFTTNSEGTGLGLAISKRIVSAHNGQILVNSFPGGTVFTIKLPVDTSINTKR